MDRDTLILIAFGVFIVLVGIRLKQGLGEWKKLKQNVDSDQDSEYSPVDASGSNDTTGQPGNRRRILTMVQLAILSGLLIYMGFILIRDLSGVKVVDYKDFFLRCLIFVFTIYILGRGVFKVFKQKAKENSEE